MNLTPRDRELVRAGLSLLASDAKNRQVVATLERDMGAARAHEERYDHVLALARRFAPRCICEDEPGDGLGCEVHRPEDYDDSDGPPDDYPSESEALYYADLGEAAEARQREASGW